MKIASIADVKAKLSAFVNSTEDSPVIITRNGKAIAAIVPLTDDEDVERLMMGYSPRLRAILAASRKSIDEGRQLTHEEFWNTARKTTRSRTHKGS